MGRKSWKAGERRAARTLGAERNPLSGGNSGISRSDSTHRHLFIETKHLAKQAVWTLHDEVKEKAAREKKLPVLALMKNNRPGIIYAVHSRDLVEFARSVLYGDVPLDPEIDWVL
jgi:hypothetical protein